MSAPGLLLLCACALASPASGEAAPPGTGDTLATLLVSSTPSGSSVFVGYLRVGVTPLTLRRAPGDSLRITVIRQFFEPWKATVNLRSSDTVRLEAALRKLETALSVMAGDSTAAISVDGRTVGRGPSAGCQVTPGDHEIRVSDSLSSRSVARRVTIGEGTTLTYSAALGVRSPWRLAGSMLIPGYAPCADGAYLKAAGMFGAAVAAFAYSLSASGTYGDRLAAFTQAQASYAAAASDQDAVQRREIMIRSHDDLNRAYRARTASYLILGGVYALNIVDTILNHMLTDEIRFVPSGERRFAAGAPQPAAMLRAEFAIR